MRASHPPGASTWKIRINDAPIRNIAPCWIVPINQSRPGPHPFLRQPKLPLFEIPKPELKRKIEDRVTSEKIEK